MGAKRALGTPGGYIRRTKIRRFQLIIGGYFLYSFVLAVVLWTLWPDRSTSLWTLIALGPLMLYVARGPLIDVTSPWFKGLGGEQDVARALAPLLGHGYEVLHDLDLGHGNVDHVVVGPTGIYAIETKASRGRFYFGSEGRLMRSGLPAERMRTQAVGSAQRVRQRLAACGQEHFVIAVLALTKATLPKGPMNLRLGYAVEAASLAAWISRRMPRLEPTDVDRVCSVLAQYTR
jgi:nuclease-like protein